MSVVPSKRRSMRVVSVAGILVVAGAAAGCERRADGPAAAAKLDQAETRTAEAPAPVRSDSINLPNYDAKIALHGPCKSGDTCKAEVTLETKGDYHINDEYPYRFKLDDPTDGVEFPQPVVGREQGRFEAKRAVLEVPFVAKGAGDAKVSGTFSLSVCSSANCVMDKRSLETIAKVE